MKRRWLAGLLRDEPIVRELERLRPGGESNAKELKEWLESRELARPVLLRPGVILGLGTTAAALLGVGVQYSIFSIRLASASLNEDKAVRQAEASRSEAQETYEETKKDIKRMEKMKADIDDAITKATDALNEVNGQVPSEPQLRLAEAIKHLNLVKDIIAPKISISDVRRRIREAIAATKGVPLSNIHSYNTLKGDPPRGLRFTKADFQVLTVEINKEFADVDIQLSPGEVISWKIVSQLTTNIWWKVPKKHKEKGSNGK